LDKIKLNEKNMKGKKRSPVQVNLLQGMIEVINRIKNESGAPKARVVEYFVRLGMNAAGYDPKEQDPAEQINYGSLTFKNDTEKSEGNNKLERTVNLLENIFDSLQKIEKILIEKKK